jgi:hypothetical protein
VAKSIEFTEGSHYFKRINEQQASGSWNGAVEGVPLDSAAIYAEACSWG